MSAVRVDFVNVATFAFVNAGSTRRRMLLEEEGIRSPPVSLLMFDLIRILRIWLTGKR